MKRLSLLLLLAGSVLLHTGTASAAPKIPDFKFPETFQARIHVAGGLTVTSTHDTTGNCSPGQAWTMTESVDLEITDKVTGTLFGKSKIASRFATGNVQQKSGIKAYRTTNNCPPQAKVKLDKPECETFGGRSLANLVPDTRLNGSISIGMTRRGGGAQDISCVGEIGISSKPFGTAVTPLAIPFTPINLPLNVPVNKFRKADRGDKIIRVIRINGQCEKARITTGGPGVVKAAASPTCKVDGLFNVIVKRLDN